MHAGLCWEFMMLGLIIETLVFRKGTVAMIALHLWLSCNWLFGIFTPQKLAQIISETRTLFSSLR